MGSAFEMLSKCYTLLRSQLSMFQNLHLVVRADSIDCQSNRPIGGHEPLSAQSSQSAASVQIVPRGFNLAFANLEQRPFAEKMSSSSMQVNQWKTKASKERVVIRYKQWRKYWDRRLASITSSSGFSFASSHRAMSG